MLAHRRRAAVHLVERRARHREHLGRALRRHGRAAPIAPHESELADAAAALDVPDEGPRASVLAPDGQPSHRHEVQRVGVVALAKQDPAVRERTTLRGDRLEPEPARERRQDLEVSADLLTADGDEALAERVVLRERRLEVALGHARKPDRLGRPGAGAAPSRRSRQQRLLPEVLARLEPDQDHLAAVAVARVDLHGAVEDDVHRIARVTLVKHRCAGRQRELPRGRRERVEARGVEPAEQPAAAERLRQVHHGAA